MLFHSAGSDLFESGEQTTMMCPNSGIKILSRCKIFLRNSSFPWGKNEGKSLLSFIRVPSLSLVNGHHCLMECCDFNEYNLKYWDR